jgi:hypothetical protein
MRTALSLVAHQRSHCRLFSGRLLALQAGEPMLLHPTSLLPYADPEGESAGLGRCLDAPVTCLAGTPEQLLHLSRQIRARTGKTSFQQIWPDLTAVFWTRGQRQGPPEPLRAVVGERPMLLETVFRPEGPLALEDPRHGQLRLLTDHGMYFEFLPPAEAGRTPPARLDLEQARPGVPYELALTAAGGLWACRIGYQVVLRSLQPPLVRSLEPAPPQEMPVPAARVEEARAQVRSDAPAVTSPAQALHRRSAGIPVAQPEKFVHSPWSIPVDRG